jgi:hypothetical protein
VLVSRRSTRPSGGSRLELPGARPRAPDRHIVAPDPGSPSPPTARRRSERPRSSTGRSDWTLRARTGLHKKGGCALLPGGVAQDVRADRLALAVIAHVNGRRSRSASRSAVNTSLWPSLSIWNGRLRPLLAPRGVPKADDVTMATAAGPFRSLPLLLPRCSRSRHGKVKLRGPSRRL